ncbi:MAG TPA: CvpA family protein [Kiritimatiellia bacterium]|nr:CvpA family protein [Kiritimatiellia bacterium]HRX06620.1 CvpA family protein [Kiritimatiellia bacterium]
MDWATWNWVDWLFVAMLLYGGAMGAVRGLSHELAMLIGMIAAVTVTWLFYEPVSAWLCGHWTELHPEITRLVAVAALVTVTLAGMHALRKGLGALMTFSFKGPVERVGGLLAGVVRRGAVFLLALLLASFVPWSALQRAVMFQSRVGSAVLPHLVEGYNAVAERIAVIQAEVPVGVELPHAVMPPEVPPEAYGE